MAELNAAQLKRLLFIPDAKKETIFGVVGRMEVLMSIFEADAAYHHLLPFLKTYYFVTKKAAEKYVERKHYFYNLRDYETLDVYFASLYFRPLYTYLVEGERELPWKTYFHYCRKNDGLAFLRMLLGINAHINGDLCKALVDLDYRHEGDYFLVNDVLQEVVPEVTRYLFFSEHDLVSAGGLVVKNFFLSEFHIVIEKWRSEAWCNARLRPKRSSKARFLETEKIGKSLISDIETGAAIPFLIDTLGKREHPTSG